MKIQVAILMIVLLWTSQAAAGGFSIQQASIRANGLMGAFTAFGNHVSTIYYNPAGLATVENIQFSTGSSLILPETTFHNLTPRAPLGQVTQRNNDLFVAPHLFGSYRVEEGLTVGIGFYRPFGFRTTWPGNWVGRNSSVEAELSTYFVNPAIGYTLPDFGIGRIHVGVGLQVAVTGNFRYQAAVTTFTPEGTFNLDTRMQEISFGFNAGLIYSPAEIIALGFAYRSPVEVEFEGEADFVDLPVGFPPTASVSTRIEFPASWTGAVNLSPHPRWRAEIDVVWWRWSSYERLNFIFDQTIVALSSNRLVDQRNFGDSWEFKGGVEYTGLLDDRLTLRTGAGYQQSPVEDAFVDAKQPGADRWLFSGGFTYKLTSAVEIDGAYIFLRAAERRVTDTHASLDGIYTGHAHMPSLGITLNF